MSKGTVKFFNETKGFGFITEEGLWLSKNNPHNKNYNENELYFSLFTLQDEK